MHISNWSYNYLNESLITIIYLVFVCALFHGDDSVCKIILFHSYGSVCKITLINHIQITLHLWQKYSRKVCKVWL